MAERLFLEQKKYDPILRQRIIFSEKTCLNNINSHVYNTPWWSFVNVVRIKRSGQSAVRGMKKSMRFPCPTRIP